MADASQIRDTEPPRGNPSVHRNTFGFMASYRSTIARCDAKKSPNVLIDSGASHHFFFSKKAFVTYAKIQQEVVKSAYGNSMTVGKGTVSLPISEHGIIVEAYHTPKFSANILSVSLLTEKFDIFFTTSSTQMSTCQILSKKDGKILKSISIQDGLYLMAMDVKLASIQQPTNRSNCGFCGASASANSSKMEDVLACHNKLGHPSPARYMKLSAMRDDVPQFTRATLENLVCIPCSLGKLKSGSIKASARFTIYPLERVHVDITGRMSTPSIGQNEYAIGFMDDFTAKSDVYFAARKDSLYPALVHYKHRSEAVTGHRLLNIRLDNAGENTASTVKDFCNEHGITLENSPPYAPPAMESQKGKCRNSVCVLVYYYLGRS